MSTPLGRGSIGACLFFSRVHVVCISIIGAGRSLTMCRILFAFLLLHPSWRSPCRPYTFNLTDKAAGCVVGMQDGKEHQACGNTSAMMMTGERGKSWNWRSAQTVHWMMVMEAHHTSPHLQHCGASSEAVRRKAKVEAYRTIEARGRPNGAASTCCVTLLPCPALWLPPPAVASLSAKCRLHPIAPSTTDASLTPTPDFMWKQHLLHLLLTSGPVLPHSAEDVAPVPASHLHGPRCPHRHPRKREWSRQQSDEVRLLRLMLCCLSDGNVHLVWTDMEEFGCLLWPTHCQWGIPCPSFIFIECSSTAISLQSATVFVCSFCSSEGQGPANNRRPALPSAPRQAMHGICRCNNANI